ncbi:MAG: hypothetical protein AVO38_10750 [delta proteobacterium ML8_D]|jgi:dodecin|nr:MAG: hypothetical protein AVO38_10750 [delta proteobacterium ML8_D]
MSIAKVIEISASSAESFEDAIRQGIKRAAETIENIQAAWIKELKTLVEKGKVVEFRVIMKITFVLH